MSLEGRATSAYQNVLKGKITNLSPYAIDPTLSVEGAAADAKATGDAIADAKSEAVGITNTHTSNTENPHNVTATQVGLGNVDNTSDMDKPVSTAQAEAIADAKKAGTDAQSSASNAQNTANEAKEAATNAQNTADSAVLASTKIAVTVTLVSGNWAENTQTVAVSGVTEQKNVLITPAPDSYVAYGESVVYCTGQGDGTLTFTCDEVPTVNLNVNVLIMN